MGKLIWIDYLIISVSVLIAIGIGMYFSKRQKTSDKFFTGGRNIPSWAIGISIMATLISSVTFLAYPAAAYNSNWILLVQGLMVPLVLVGVIGFIVPLFRKSIGISAYEYFEKRFGIVARMYSSIAFLLMHFSKLGTVIYLMGLALGSMMGVDILLTIWIITVSIVIITFFGGLEGVIWMDVFQGIWLFGGGLLCIGILLFVPEGGPNAVFHTMSEAKKISFSPYDLDFTKLTFIVIALNGIFYAIQKYGTDQTIVQRYLAAKTDKAAIKASLIGVLLTVPVWTMFMFIGSCLFAFYKLSPGLLPADTLAEGVFPFFITTQLPIGIKGFIIAALVSAAISTIASDINCLAAIGVEDYYVRFKSGLSDWKKLKMARIIIVASGFLAAVIATIYLKAGGEGVLGILFGLYSIFSAGIVGIFLLGVLVRRANSNGLIVGMIVCILFTGYATLTTTNIEVDGTKQLMLDFGKYNFPHHKYMLGVYSHFILFFVGWIASYFFKSVPVDESLTLSGFLKNKRNSQIAS
ncbi:MAG TPA: sodium:solute symporter [Bacteroidales bacterium]|nr:sodium:solute symporter [Bacteroidales bacterium]